MLFRRGHRIVGLSHRPQHEHGIGIGKRKFMELEHGESYGLMKKIKELIDPKGLMNPGKILSSDPEVMTS